MPVLLPVKPQWIQVDLGRVSLQNLEESTLEVSGEKLISVKIIE